MTAVEPCGYRGDDVLPWRGSDKSSSVLVTPEQHFPNSSTTSKLLSMPLVKIDMIRGVRTPQEIKKLADVVQKVMLEHFNAPPRDRYQVITQHEDYELICEDTNLGYTRSNKLVIIQIFQQGRNTEQKQRVYKELHENLSQSCGVPGEDLIISCAENTKADWSFGMGQAQFLTGAL